MATYTSNYGLHQWEPEDNFLRTDFNEDLKKIDEAIKGVETDTDQKLTRKAEIITGTYTGNGNIQTIYLGFHPQALLVDGGLYGLYFITPEMVKQPITLTDNGFSVDFDKGSGDKVNAEGYPYFYLAAQ